MNMMTMTMLTLVKNMIVPKVAVPWHRHDHHHHNANDEDYHDESDDEDGEDDDDDDGHDADYTQGCCWLPGIGR